MKLSVDRRECKGPLGGLYYETDIKVILEPEEEEAASQDRMLTDILLGGKPGTEEVQSIMYLCKRIRISMEDLQQGITAKAGNDTKLAELAWFENLVRERCQNFKVMLQAKQAFRTKQSFEEEI